MKTTAKSIAILLMMGLAAFFFNSCNKEKPEAPEHIEINTYDDLDYFQNSIVHIDSLHNFIYRAYGVPLYADDTSHLYIGVESLEEARDIFMNWIAPDAVVKENSGDLTCELTDEHGLSQGTGRFPMAPVCIISRKSPSSTTMPGRSSTQPNPDGTSSTLSTTSNLPIYKVTSTMSTEASTGSACASRAMASRPCSAP